jgi:outer membrane receptor protein involved in Fe transport
MKKILLLALLFSCFAASAQNVEEQAAKIASLEQEVASLKEKGTTWDKIVSALPKISGYAQIRYEYKDGDSGESTFQLRRVRLSLDGKISKKLDYKLQAELTSFKLLDAYFSYKPFKQLNLRAGQFKLPFSIENTDYGPTKLELIDYPMALTYLVGYNEDMGDGIIKANGRDLGAKLYGSFLDGVIGYDLGVFNGAGLNVKDNNKSKDVVGRLMIRPLDGLLISGSYMWGEYGEDFIKRERWGVGVCYDKDAWLARAEYIGGKTGAQKSDGWYVMGGYRFHKNFMVAARYDTFTWDTDARSESNQETYTVGLLWQPIKYLRLQVNYMFENQLFDRERNVFQLQTAVMF